MGKKGERELEKIERIVVEHLEAGHQAFIVPVYLMADGTALWKQTRMREAAQAMLLDGGLNVTGSTHDEWRYTVYFEVEVPPVSEPVKKCPLCAETIKAEALICRFCGSDVTSGTRAIAPDLSSINTYALPPPPLNPVLPPPPNHASALPPPPPNYAPVLPPPPVNLGLPPPPVNPGLPPPPSYALVLPPPPATAGSNADGSRIAVVLGEYGHYSLLGPEYGMSDTEMLELTKDLRERRYVGAAGDAAVLADVREAARAGGWVAIGAWRFALDFLPAPEESAPDVLAMGVDAMHGLNITNLRSHLRGPELLAYKARHGDPPQGNWGPVEVAPTVAPGWYADPHGEAPLRYWDGASWTGYTA